MLKYREIKFNRAKSNGSKIKSADAQANISMNEKCMKQNGAFTQHALPCILSRTATCHPSASPSVWSVFQPSHFLLIAVD